MGQLWLQREAKTGFSRAVQNCPANSSACRYHWKYAWKWRIHTVNCDVHTVEFIQWTVKKTCTHGIKFQTNKRTDVSALFTRQQIEQYPLPGQYSQYARNLYDPTDVLAEDFVCYGPSGQLVPLLNGPAIHWDTKLGHLVLALHQVWHHLLPVGGGYREETNPTKLILSITNLSHQVKEGCVCTHHTC